MLFLLGVMGFVLNWRQGFLSIGIIVLIYFLKKIFQMKWSILAGIALGGIALLSYFLDLSFIEILLTTAGLSFIFFLKSSFEELNSDDEFELFFLDNKKLKCLSTKDNDYKGYALNPKGFLKTYDTKFIQSFHFKGKNLLISIGNEIIRPRELNQNELKSVKKFVTENFPELLEIEEIYQENLKSENRFYLYKFIIISPILMLSLVIYFFGDNGRNEPLTYTCLGLMVLLPYLLFRIFRKN